MHLFNSCFFLAQVPDRNDHSRASTLEVPSFAENLPVLGGAKHNTKNQKRFSMVDPRWTVPRNPIYHTTVWLLIHHPTLCTLLQKVCFGRRAAETRRVPDAYLAPGETHCQVQQVLQPARPKEHTAARPFLPISQWARRAGGRICIWIKTVLLSWASLSWEGQDLVFRLCWTNWESSSPPRAGPKRCVYAWPCLGGTWTIS